MARCLLGEKPSMVEFVLDKDGSFAGTFGHMNEDGGMLGGVLGMLPDNAGILKAHSIAREENLK